MNHTTISLLTGLVLALTLMLSINGISVPNSLLAQGYERTGGLYAENSCGNGILPENVPCINAGSNAEGDEAREKNNGCHANRKEGDACQ